jgi:2-polyprenyl-3-methyl-5-hydroxy-6-metoxy-1,4-benzoquinol methylase
MVKGGVEGSYRLYAMRFSNGHAVKGELALACTLPQLKRGDTGTVNLLEPSIALNGKLLPFDTARKVASRKFIAEVAVTDEGIRFSRLCSHYLPFEDKVIGPDYYFGDDYVDYPRQTGAVDAVALVQRHCPAGRLLDIGCALGIYTRAFLDAGFDAYGMDISEFAIGEAAKRVGARRVRHASLDTAEIPFRGEFDAFWLWDVLEHCAAPEAALVKVTCQARPGAHLFVHTSNADSLTHRIFGSDWEGYSDYSHRGVDQVTCSNLRLWLHRLGWEIVEWECSNIWVEGVDPVVLRLREVFHESPELRLMLEESDLGDAIRAVARKR